jgi:protein-tyrosine phosphatase
VPVADGVWLGRLPLPWEPDWVRFASIIDLTAELDLGGHPGLVSLPLLDLAPPPPDRLRAAADAVEAQRRRAAPGPLLVGCALGFSRSAAVLLTWLCRSGRAATVDEALLTLRHCRPQVLVSPALLAAVAAAVGSPAEPAA